MKKNSPYGLYEKEKKLNAVLRHASRKRASSNRYIDKHVNVTNYIVPRDVVENFLGFTRQHGCEFTKKWSTAFVFFYVPKLSHSQHSVRLWMRHFPLALLPHTGRFILRCVSTNSSHEICIYLTSNSMDFIFTF